MYKTTKIRIITPVVSRRSRPSSNQDEYSERIKRLAGLCSETEVDRVRIEKGPPSIESRYDDAMATPDILRLIKEAEGVDGIVVNCFCDPGVKAGREITDIPVIGPCLASMLVASSICERFSVVTVLKEVVPAIEENARMYGLMDKLASTRYIEMPVLDLHKDEEKTLEALVEQGRKAIDEDGAQVLILGCTGMTGMAEKLSEEVGVQVIDPLPAAVKFVETLASLRLTQSKLTYPVPPEKTMIL